VRRNEIEILLRLRDQVTADLKRASRSLAQFEKELERTQGTAGRVRAQIRGLSQSFGGLGKLLGPLTAGLGAYGLSRAAYTWATGASKAEIATRLFRKQLERMGQDADAGMVKLEAIAERLHVLPQDIAEYSTQLLRQGLTMDEIATLFEGAAASALAAGKSTKEGIDAVTNAVVTQQSIYLNYAGIAENLNQAYKEMAKTLGKSVEALTKEEKARAAVNLVMQATKEEVRDLDQLLGGLPGKQNELNREWAEFRQELGERLIPAVSELISLTTSGLRELNALFDWLDHVFGDKVKLAARDARDEIRAVKRELGEARSADELIDKMKALSDTLSGPGKEAWQEYVAEAEKSKESIKDISKAATEAIVKFLAVSSVTQEQTVAKAKDALMVAIERSGLSRDLVEYLKKAAERGGDVFAGTLAQVRKELSEQVSRISGGTEAAQLQRQRLLNQIELLNHLEGAVVPLRKAEAELAATQNEQARILKVLNGEIKNVNTNIANTRTNVGNGGLKNDLDDAAKSAKALLDYVKEATDTFYGRQGNQPLTAIVNAPGHDDIAGGRMLEPKLWNFDLDERGSAPALPGWDWDLAGREAAANFAEGYADYLRDKGYHEMLADLSEYVAGYAAELEEGVREPFLRSLVSARNDVGIANAARDVGLMLDQRIHDAMVRGSQDHGIVAAIRQQAEDARRRYESDLRLMYRDPRRTNRLGWTPEPHYQKSPMDALKGSSFDYGIEAAIRRQQSEAEVAKEAFEDAVAASERLLSNIDGALSSLEKMGDALSSGSITEWFAGLSDLLNRVPVVGGVLSEAAGLAGRIASWAQWLDPTTSIISLKQAEAEYQKLGDRLELISQDAYAAVEKYQEKALFNLLSVDRYRVQINEFALGIAQTLESGVLGGLRNAMKAFLEGAEDWYQQLKDGIKGAIENAIIEAVIQGAIIKGALGQMLSDLTDALAAGNTNAARQAIQGIADVIPQLADDLAEVLEPLRDALASFGSDENTTSGVVPPTTSITYQLPTAPVLAAPSWVDEMGQHVARFGEAVNRFANTQISIVVEPADLAYSVRGLA